MKIWAVLVGVKFPPDQDPKPPVIRKVGGYGSGSDMGRGLYGLADIWDGGHGRPTSFSTKLCGIRRKPEILHSDFGSKVSGEGVGFDPLPRWMNLYCAPPFRSTSAIFHRALLSFMSSSMPLIALLLGIRLPSGLRRERARCPPPMMVSLTHLHLGPRTLVSFSIPPGISD